MRGWISKGQAMRLSVIIPYRFNADRERHVQWVTDRYSLLLPDAEIIYGLEKTKNRYFCRSEAINNGAREAEGEVYLIADGDAIFFPKLVWEAVEIASDNGGMVMPYWDYHELDQQSTEQILSSSSALDPTRYARAQAVYQNSNASLVVISALAFWRVRGFDERFIGWGPEDQAFGTAVETICGPPRRVKGHPMMHLWHPVAKGTTRTNPYYKQSLRIWDQYKAAAGNELAMLKVIAGGEI